MSFDLVLVLFPNISEYFRIPNTGSTTGSTTGSNVFFFPSFFQQGWAPPSTATGPSPLPFFPTPLALNNAGTLWVQPLKAYGLRNMETLLFTQDPFVTIRLICGCHDQTSVVHTSTAFDKGKQASWEEVRDGGNENTWIQFKPSCTLSFLIDV